MNKQYIIYFGKNPEELESGCWHDGLTDNYNKGNFSKELIEKETCGKFETDDINFLWDTLLSLRDNPPTMWYWVYEVEENKEPTIICSGAIDPDDVYNIAECIECPDWVTALFEHEKNNITPNPKYL